MISNTAFMFASKTGIFAISSERTILSLVQILLFKLIDNVKNSEAQCMHCFYQKRICTNFEVT